MKKHYLVLVALTCLPLSINAEVIMPGIFSDNMVLQRNITIPVWGWANPGNSNEGCGWAELREAQAMTLQLPNTGMCVTTDIGNPWDIHPTNKQDVGKRLAAMALNNIYNKAMVCSGPSYKSMNINDNQIIISFDNIGTGLFTPDRYGCIKGFEVAGHDSTFYFARASIIGNTIALSSEKVASPIAVRFGWFGDASDCNLFNKEGFPAVPFRTDEWHTITLEERYTIEKLQ